MPDVRHFNECILIHAAKLPLFEGTEMDRKSAKVIFAEQHFLFYKNTWQE